LGKKLLNDLFHNPSEELLLVQAPGQMGVYPQWLSTNEADNLFQQLMRQIAWQEEWIQIYGRRVKVPRMVAWYGDSKAVYRYSGVIHHPSPWIDCLYSVKQQLESRFNVRFNSVLCNRYRDGLQAMGWHSDDEWELGPEPFIASLSLGASRFFDYRRKGSSEKFQRVELHSGDLLLMRGVFQQFWQHRIPKQSRVKQTRINLTFRCITTDSTSRC
jgi:alkylated DNA repair dioxygenase AlkB